jgi:hypothetical protein
LNRAFGCAKRGTRSSFQIANESPHSYALESETYPQARSKTRSKTGRQIRREVCKIQTVEIREAAARESTSCWIHGRDSAPGLR